MGNISQRSKKRAEKEFDLYFNFEQKRNTMKIRLFTKGKDDFGKRKLSDDTWYFESFGFVSINDIHLYYYPQRKTIAIYKITDILNVFNDNETGCFSYTSGKMNDMLIGKSDSSVLIKELLNSNKEQSRKIGLSINDIILKIQSNL